MKQEVVYRHAGETSPRRTDILGSCGRLLVSLTAGCCLQSWKRPRAIFHSVSAAEMETGRVKLSAALTGSTNHHTHLYKNIIIDSDLELRLIECADLFFVFFLSAAKQLQRELSLSANDIILRGRLPPRRQTGLCKYIYLSLCAAGLRGRGDYLSRLSPVINVCLGCMR